MSLGNVTYAAGNVPGRGLQLWRTGDDQRRCTTAGPPERHRTHTGPQNDPGRRRDVSIVTVAVLDAQGHMVPTATNKMSFSISGGKIIGVGNGDPSSHEADKASQRAVFNGLAQVIVQSTAKTGRITLTATSPGLKSANGDRHSFVHSAAASSADWS